MEPHQSMEQQQRESVLLNKPQLQQNVMEEEEKVPRPHRCNDRLEDIVQGNLMFRCCKTLMQLWLQICKKPDVAHCCNNADPGLSLGEDSKIAEGYAWQALFEGDPRKTLPGPFKLYWRCMKSKPGYDCIAERNFNGYYLWTACKLSSAV